MRKRPASLKSPITCADFEANLRSRRLRSPLVTNSSVMDSGTPSWIGEGGVCGDKGWVSGDVSWSRGRGIAFPNHLHVYCNGGDHTWLLRETQTSTDSWFFLCIPGFWRNFKDVGSLIRQRLNQG